MLVHAHSGLVYGQTGQRLGIVIDDLGDRSDDGVDLLLVEFFQLLLCDSGFFYQARNHFFCFHGYILLSM